MNSYYGSPIEFDLGEFNNDNNYKRPTKIFKVTGWLVLVAVGLVVLAALVN